MLVSDMIEHTLTLGDGKLGEEINDRALDLGHPLHLDAART